MQTRIEDEVFKKEKAEKTTKSQKFFAEAPPKVNTSAARKSLQQDVDKLILMDMQPMTKKYLGARFTLSKHDNPATMKWWDWSE